MKITLVKFIPRITFRYKSKTTNSYKSYKDLVFPARPKIMISEIKKILNDSKDVIELDEMGILLSHDLVTKDTDTICAVGLGGGISLIHNCLKERPDKSFIGIEASSNQIKKTISNAKLNKINSAKYKLINGYGGTTDSHIYGAENKISKEFIDINKIKFDVLELDCEGAELNILSNLTAKPRHIIVETHPSLVSIDYNEFSNLMTSKGYFLNFAYTVFGQKVPFKNIPSYFSQERISVLRQGIDWGNNLLVLTFSFQ